MKKVLLIVLVAVLLCVLFTSCSRRNQYEDILESQKVAESLDAIPETNGNITGESAPDYATPVMLQTGNTPFYEGKTLEDLQAISRASGNGSINMVPTGRLFYSIDGTQTYFYNKLTGNFNNWCSDPLCDGSDCIWTASELYLQYVSDEYLYFLANSIDESGEACGIFRCDFQRNHIEKIMDIAYYRVPIDDDGDGRIDGFFGYMDDVKIVYENNDVVYYLQTAYNTNNYDTIGSLYALNMSTGDKQLLSGDSDLASVTIVADTVFYVSKRNLYKTDLSFSSSELFREEAYIDQANDVYIIIRERGSVARCSYNVKTGEMHMLNDIYGNVCLSGGYLYYSRKLTDDEIAKDALKEYYTFTWEEFTLPNGEVIMGESNTRSAGKVYRVPVNSDKAAEECVLQLTYKDIPVRIDQIEIDGEVIYFSFHNHEGFKNFYNQEFDVSGEYGAVCYAVADLQNGSVTILEIPQTE